MGTRSRQRVWFSIEAKSFELTVGGVGRRPKYVIIERNRDVVAWIRFGEEGVRTLLKGVEVCCEEKIPKNWRQDWKEGKRVFKLECGSNKIGRFLQCMVRDGEGKKHSIFFSEGNGFVNGWSVLAGKLKVVGVKMSQEKEEKLQTILSALGEGGLFEDCSLFRQSSKVSRERI